MILSLIIGLLAGYMAAVNRRWNMVILPAADILQSVPVLGFFPAAVFLFIRIFGTTYPAIGVEIAAIFLIITSALWNLIFAVYESVTTIPNDLMLASQQFGLRGYSHWTRVVLPAVMHKLAYNSMISWANGWYFLIASEIIVMGHVNYRLPGLGSYLEQTMKSGDYGHAIFGVLVLTAIIVFFHLIVWARSNAWSVRFLYDTADTPAPQVANRSRLRFYMARSRVLHVLWDNFLRPLIRSMVFFLSLILERQRTRRGSVVLVVLLIVSRILSDKRNVGFSKPSADSIPGNACGAAGVAVQFPPAVGRIHAWLWSGRCHWQCGSGATSTSRDGCCRFWKWSQAFRQRHFSR